MLEPPCGQVSRPPAARSWARSSGRARDRFLLFSKRKYGITMLETKRTRAKTMKPKKTCSRGRWRLKTLDVLGPLHGYGIARRIEQISGDLLAGICVPAFGATRLDTVPAIRSE
jgi:hypothetical protein